jgi:Mce-associated membrane protein
MPKTTTGRAPGPGTRRTMTAAARAAAKRAERGHREAGAATATATDEESPRRAERPLAGRTVLIEAPKDGWDDPPEPSPESFEEDGPQERSERGPGGRRRLLTSVLAVLLVVGLVALAALGWQYRNGRLTETARTEALAAARKAAPIVLSYDYRHLDKDFSTARAHLTGDFRDEYGKTTKTVVAPTAEKYHGVVKATVAAPASGAAPAAAVVSASPDKVVVLLFINQVTESTQVSGSRVDLNRVRMTMDRTGDGWKVSAVDAL